MANFHSATPFECCALVVFMRNDFNAQIKKNKWREKKNQTNNNIRLVKPDCMMDDLMSL